MYHHPLSCHPATMYHHTSSCIITHHHASSFIIMYHHALSCIIMTLHHHVIVSSCHCIIMSLHHHVSSCISMYHHVSCIIMHRATSQRPLRSRREFDVEDLSCYYVETIIMLSCCYEYSDFAKLMNFFIRID